MASPRTPPRSATAPVAPTEQSLPLHTPEDGRPWPQTRASPVIRPPPLTPHSLPPFQGPPQRHIPRRPVGATPTRTVAPPQTATPSVAPPPRATPSVPHQPAATSSIAPLQKPIPSAAAPRVEISSLRRRIDPDLLWFILTSFVFVFACLVVFYADNPNWVLVRLSPPSGTLLLFFLSKFTDWTLKGMVEKAWGKVQWGPLLHKSGNLLDFLIVGSGVEGAIKVLTSMERQREPQRVNRWRRISPKIWSAAKLPIWGMVQFPGIILMAVVEPETAYIPTEFKSATGGIGTYSSSTATMGVSDPFLTNMVMNIFQDLRFAMIVPPTSSVCSKSAWCRGYLLTGGLMTVSSWPTRFQPDRALTAYVMKDVPSYQVDVWDVSDQTLAWDMSQCEVYYVAGVSGSGITLCVNSDRVGGEDILRIMAFACGVDDPEDGGCLPEAGTEMPSRLYQVGISINRRRSTVAVDRYTGAHLKLLDPGVPTAETASMTPSNLTESFSTFLCPLGSESRHCSGTSPNGLLTFHVANTLWQGSAQADSLGPVLLISNFVGASLFMHNPFWQLSIQLGAVIDGPVEGAPEEVHFQGSPARAARYVSPKAWTAVAYAVSAVFLLILVMGALGWGLAYYSSTSSTSSFTGLDIFRLDMTSAGPGEGNGQRLAELFSDVKSDKHVMSVASGVYVKQA